MPEQKTDTFRIVPAGLPTDVPGTVFQPYVGQGAYNGYIETTTNPLNGNKRVQFIKRPGSDLFRTFSGYVTGLSDTDQIRGLHSWEETNQYFVVIGKFVIAVTEDGSLGTPSTPTLLELLHLTTTTGAVRFCEVTYGLKKYLFFNDGTLGYFIDKDSPTKVNYVSSTQVVDTLITAGGTGYTSNTTVTFGDPTTGKMVATYSAVAGTYTVTFLHEHGLTTSNRIYFDATSGIGTDGAYAVASTPTTKTLTFSTGGLTTSGTCLIGVTATATAEVENGAVIGITMTKKGIGYSSAPTITFNDGSTGAETGAAATAIMSGFPTSGIPRPVSIDGFVFVAADDTADIYESGLGDLDYWASDEFITVNQYPGTIVGLAKQSNQVVALKTDSIEYLFNAGNETGSVLSRTSQAVVQIGCVDINTIDDREDILFFVGITNIGNIGVWKIDGFKDQKVSIEAIDRIFSNTTYNILNGIFGYSLRTAGHFFYVVTNQGLSLPSFVYDLEEKYWYYWTNSAQTLPFSGKLSTHSLDMTKVAEALLIDLLSVGPLADVAQADISAVSGGISLTKISALKYTDINSTPILCSYQFPFIDMDTMNRKRWTYLSFIGEWGTKAGHTDANIDFLTIYHKDENWDNESNGRNLYLTGRPFLTNLGTSRRRAWRIEYLKNGPFKLESLECKYELNAH